MIPTYRRALIVGAGDGLSASVARAFAGADLGVALAARNPAKLERLAAEIGASTHRADAAAPAEIDRLFEAAAEALGGAPDVVLYNPSARLRGALIDLDRDAVLRAIQVTAHGGFVTAQAAARRMLPQKHGAILFTGASASVKGYPGSAPFAMGKFALRGLAQSIARELQPQGIHVAHFVIDGAIRNPGVTEETPDSKLDPAAIARAYLDVLKQDRSAWSWEIELRPWVERF